MTRREPYVDQLFREAKTKKPINRSDVRIERFCHNNPSDPFQRPSLKITHIPTEIFVMKEMPSPLEVHPLRFEAELMAELKGKINA